MLRISSWLFKPHNTKVRTMFSALKEHIEVDRTMDLPVGELPKEDRAVFKYGPVNSMTCFDGQKVNVLKFDLDGYDVATGMFNFQDKIKIDVEKMQPKLVYMQHLRKDNFMDVRMRMKQLGYDGYFFKSCEECGMATFYETKTSSS